MKNIENLDVLRMWVSDKKKDGTPIVDFRGNPARKVSIKVKQYQGKYLYSFPSSKQDDPIFAIAPNTQIKAIVWENNGFVNFKLPTRMDFLEERVKDLEDAVFESANTREFSEEELTLPEDNPDDTPDF